MKKLFIPFLAFLLIAFISCETETIEQTTDNSINLTNTSGSQNTNSVAIFQNSLQWTSFTIAEVLHKNPNLKAFFNSKVSTQNTASLNDILEDNSTRGINFRLKFVEYLTLNIQPVRPGGQRDKPGIPLGGNGDHSVSTPENIVNGYLEYMLDNNCVEIYLPYTINNFLSFSYYSTAHPLNDNDDSNDGFRRSGSSSSAIIETVVITPSGFQNKNVIVARPVRSNSNAILLDPCAYPEYNMNFTDFLDN